jgi:hypothetical protein
MNIHSAPNLFTAGPYMTTGREVMVIAKLIFNEVAMIFTVISYKY